MRRLFSRRIMVSSSCPAEILLGSSSLVNTRGEGGNACWRESCRRYCLSYYSEHSLGDALWLYSSWPVFFSCLGFSRLRICTGPKANAVLPRQEFLQCVAKSYRKEQGVLKKLHLRTTAAIFPSACGRGIIRFHSLIPANMPLAYSPENP